MQKPIYLDSFSDNPLLRDVLRVLARLHAFKELVRAFYFEVLLSCYACPDCAGRLRMTGDSRCECDGGHVFDPTIAFQLSECCGAHVARHILHYECSMCRQVVPSRFLFEERLFDNDYFKNMMRDSRERARQKREEIRLLLLGSRSGPLVLGNLPGIDDVPGLADALDTFVGSVQAMSLTEFAEDDVFDMNAYRQAILESVGGFSVWFDALPRLSEDLRRDRVRRFVACIYLEHEGQVDLAQYGERIVVSRH